MTMHCSSTPYRERESAESTRVYVVVKTKVQDTSSLWFGDFLFVVLFFLLQGYE